MAEIRAKRETNNEHRLLVRRLLQRVTRKNKLAPLGASDAAHSKLRSNSVGSTCSESSASTASYTSAQYDELHKRISLAADIMLKPTSVNTDLRDSGVSDCTPQYVRLALGRFIGALQNFPELAELDDSVKLRVLDEHIVAQIDLYSIFAVNTDITGWFADSQGAPCEVLFSEFIQCLRRDCLRPVVSAADNSLEAQFPARLAVNSSDPVSYQPIHTERLTSAHRRTGRHSKEVRRLLVALSESELLGNFRVSLRILYY